MAAFLNAPGGMRLGSAPLLLLAALLVAGCASSRAAKTGTPKEASAGAAATKPKKPSSKSVAAPKRRTVEDVMATIGTEAESRLREKFAAHSVDYPPQSVSFIAFKQEQRIDLWASDGTTNAFVASYPLTDTSGTLGPKLRQGDYQIPEGIYHVAWLHPNSQYHLSLKLDYPNRFDRARAAEEGRTDLGGDIFIHGDEHSIGCLAVGDQAIEELFALAARVGREQVTVLIAPWDFRRRPPPASAANPAWLPTLYAELATRLTEFRVTP